MMGHTCLSTAHDTLILVVPKGTLVAYPHQRRWPHVAVAHGALAVALVAKPPDGDAGLLAAHDQVTTPSSVAVAC